MSKAKLSDADTIRLGLLKKVGCGWKYTTFTPSWVYQYVLVHEIRDMQENPLATERCANWLRYKYPEEAVLLGLADVVEFKGWVKRGDELCLFGPDGCSVLRFAKRTHRIALDHPNCPPSLIEYAVVRFPDHIDRIGMSISSDVYLDEDFSEWVRMADQRLAAKLRLGERRAVRVADRDYD